MRPGGQSDLSGWELGTVRGLCYDRFAMALTKNEKSIVQFALGREPRVRADARICEAVEITPGQWVGCGHIVEGCEWEHCGKRTVEFRSKYLRRFPREAPKENLPIPEHVVNRQYPYSHASFVDGGQCESNRRRH